MRFSVESWDPSYGASVETVDLAAPSEPVDAGAEVPVEQWAPVAPRREVGPAESVVFVDGVRRIDARVWVTHDGLSRAGVCATVAAGAVRATSGRAEVVAAVVHRALYAMADGAAAIDTRCGTYALVPCADDTPETTYLAIHEQMTKLEQEVSAGLGADDGLVVFDGPLRGRRSPNGIGYVKTQHVQYLEPEQQQVVARLAPGERSPVFVIGGSGRYSWYLRLPGPRSHPLAGIVRCEVPGQSLAVDAIHTTDVVTRTLPRFASEAHKDSRAPQNLYPIAGLEYELRRRLGDPHLLERALRVASRST